MPIPLIPLTIIAFNLKKKTFKMQMDEWHLGKALVSKPLETNEKTKVVNEQRI